MITGIHHISLRVSNFERSLAFYRDALGLKVAVLFKVDVRRFALLDTGNSGYVELVETKEGAKATGTEVAWHFALRTSNIEAAVAAAQKAGCEITKEITRLDLTNTHTGKAFPIRVAFFKGFDGESVEFFEELPAA